MKTGTKYLSSGKFQFSKVLLALAIGIPIFLASGTLYAWLNILNPYVIIDAFLIFAVAYGLKEAISFISTFSQSRNLILNIIIGLILGFIAWYAAWCFNASKYSQIQFFNALVDPVYMKEFIIDYSKHQVIEYSKGAGGSIKISGIVLYILYAFEFVFFMAPAFQVSKPSYYNEELKTFYRETILFAVEDELFKQGFNSSEKGKYPFLKDVTLYPTMDSVPLINRENVVRLKLQNLKQTKDHGILTMERGSIKNNRKRGCELKRIRKIVKDIYVDEITLDSILRID